MHYQFLFGGVEFESYGWKYKFGHHSLIKRIVLMWAWISVGIVYVEISTQQWDPLEYLVQETVEKKQRVFKYNIW